MPRWKSYCGTVRDARQLLPTLQNAAACYHLTQAKLLRIADESYDEFHQLAAPGVFQCFGLWFLVGVLGTSRN
jgi:hypothetical protein